MTAIGIDLGTSYACVGVFRHNRVEIITNDMGNRITPTYVAFTDKGILIGDSAKNQASMNPNNTVFGINRLIGLNFSNKSVQKDIQQWPFKVIPDDEDKPQIEIQWKNKTRHFYPEEILSMIFIKLKKDAETYLSEKVTEAVITVPAYFNNYQRQIIKNSANIAELNVLRIICDSTSAGICFGLSEKSEEERHVLIFDLGGGTHSVSLIDIDGGMYEVKATAGESHLGGEDFDNKMVSYFADRFQKKYKCDLRKSPKALMTLRLACENAKKTLSTAVTASIICNSLYEGHDFMDSISREMFENINDELIKSTINLVNQVLKDCKISKNDITDIVLVGGSSRIPLVQRILQVFFNGKKLTRGIDPNEAIVYGACVQAAIIKGDISESIKDILFMDVAPHSIGIETDDGKMNVIIPRFTALPTKKTHVLSADNQTVYTVKLYEGERIKAQNNLFLGKFDLIGIKPAPKGVPQIEITIDINADGVILASARDKSTGITNRITITNYISEEKLDAFRNKINDVLNSSNSHTESDISESESKEKGVDENATNITESNCFIDDETEQEFHVVLEELEEDDLYKLYKIIDKRNYLVMTKKILKAEETTQFKDAKNLFKEFEILHQINHPCICKTYGINLQERERDKDITTIAIFIEFIDYNLSTFLDKNILSNSLKVKIAVEIAFGMLYLHNKGIIHRDLNIRNIKLNQKMEAKIVNFDQVYVYESIQNETTIEMTKKIGESVFMSPEMQNDDDEYNNKTDVYSYGVILYKMFSGNLPNIPIRNILNKIPPTFPKPSPSISECCIELIKMCMSYDPDQRPSFDQILDYMKNHSFALSEDVDSKMISQRYKMLKSI